MGEWERALENDVFFDTEGRVTVFFPRLRLGALFRGGEGGVGGCDSLDEVVGIFSGWVFLKSWPVERSQIREEGTWQESGLW